jgi:hypothetical protein
MDGSHDSMGTVTVDSGARWRPPVSGVLGVLACVLLPLSLVSGWTKAVVTDTDTYVSTVAPLADDPEIQQFVIRRLTDAIEGRIDLTAQEQKLHQALEDRGNAGLAALVPLLRGMVQQLAGDAVQNTVTKLVESPEFSAAWEAANRSAHVQFVEILSGDEDAIVASDGRVSIPLATLINTVVAELEARGYPLVGQIPTLEASVAVLETADLQKAQHGYTVIDKLGWWLPVLCLLLTIAAILLARDRRRSVFLVAVGFTIAVVVLGIGLKLAHHLMLGALPPDIDEAVANSVWTAVIADLRHAMQVTLVVSLLAIVVTWLLGPGSVPARVRDQARTIATSARRRGEDGESAAGTADGAEADERRRVLIGVAVAVVAVVALIWLI